MILSVIRLENGTKQIFILLVRLYNTRVGFSERFPDLMCNFREFSKVVLLRTLTFVLQM